MTTKPAKKTVTKAEAEALCKDLTKKKLELWEGAADLRKQGYDVEHGLNEVLLGDRELEVVYENGPQWRVKK